MSQDTKKDGTFRITRHEKSDGHSRKKARQSIEIQVSMISQRSSALVNPEGVEEIAAVNTRGHVLDVSSNVIETLDSDRSQTSMTKSFSKKGAPVVSGTQPKVTPSTSSALSTEQKRSRISKAINSSPGNTAPTPCSSDSRQTESKFDKLLVISSVPPAVHPSVKTGNKDGRSKPYHDDSVRRLVETDKDCCQKSRKTAQHSAYEGSHFPRPCISFEHTARSTGGRRLSKYGPSRSLLPGSFDRQFHYTACMPHELSRRQGRWSPGDFSETPPYMALQDYGNNKSRSRSKMSKNFANLTREKSATELRTHSQPLVSFHEGSPMAKRLQEPGVESTEEKRDAPKEVTLRREIGSHEVSVVRQETTDFEPAAVSKENLTSDNQCALLKSHVKSPKGLANTDTSVLTQMTDLSSLSCLNLAENENTAQDAGSEETVRHEDMGFCEHSLRTPLLESVQREFSTVNSETTLKGASLRETTSVYTDAVPSGCTDCCQPENTYRGLRLSQRSNCREAKDTMNESTSSVNNAEIQEEMCRAKIMSLPVNFDCDNATHSAGSHLNPAAHEFSPSLTDGYGNRFSMSSRRGVVYFRPDVLQADLSRVDTQVTLRNSNSRNEDTTDQCLRNPVQSDYTISSADKVQGSMSHLHEQREILNNDLQSSGAFIFNELQDYHVLYSQPTQMYNLSYDPVSSVFSVNFPQNLNINPFEQSINNATMAYSYPNPLIAELENLPQCQENSLNYIDTQNSMQRYTSFSADAHCSLVNPRLRVNLATPDSMPVSTNITVPNESGFNQFYTLINTPERCASLIPTQHQSQVLQPTLQSATIPYLGGPVQYFETCPSTIGTLPQMNLTPSTRFTGQEINTSSSAQTGLVLTPQMSIGPVQQSNLWHTTPVFYSQTTVPTSVASSTPLFLPTTTTHRPQPSGFASMAHTTQTGSVNEPFVLTKNALPTYETPSFSAHSLLPKASDFQLSSSNRLLNIQVGGGNDGSSRPQVEPKDPTENSALDGTQSHSPKSKLQTDRVSEAVLKTTVEKLFHFLKTNSVDSLWSTQHSLTDQDKSDICTVQTLVGFLSSLQRNLPNMTDSDLKEMLLINLKALMRLYERPSMAGNKSSHQSTNQNHCQVSPKSCPNQIAADPTTSQTQTSSSMTTEREQRRQLGKETSLLYESHNLTPNPFPARVSTTETASTLASTQRTESREESVSQIATLSGRRPTMNNVRGCRRPSQAHHGRQKLYSASENNIRPGHYEHWSSDRLLRRNL